MIHFSRLITACLLALLLSACANQGANVAEQQGVVKKMKDDTLAKLFQQKPHTRAQIRSAPGFAVFSNASVNLFVASVGGGQGIVQNNQSGAITYMKMGEIGVGFGLGVKDFRIVMVFDSQKTMNNFVEKGWVFGAQADAAAKASEKGAALGAEAVINGITVYQITESGLALQALVKGAKFWRDEALN
jgi:lipid-binding SYLF domain-containing protein